MPSPLSGFRVIELAGIGPGPHAALQLANLGATVVRVDRPVPGVELIGAEVDDILRNRRTVLIDLKTPAGRAELLDLVAHSDVLLEGLRPGVTERLGIGPEDCLAANPGLVYARLTGWGQDGPLAQTAGHDINYLAISGALHVTSQPDRPPMPPLNLLADYAGGSLFAVQGILAALLERERSGLGQVVDIAMIDGVNSLLAVYWNLTDNGAWSPTPGSNMIDGAAPFYNCYVCSDGECIAVGAVENPFYVNLLAGLELDPELRTSQMDRSAWPELKETFAAVFRTQTREYWTDRFDGREACVTPVLSLDEAAQHPHVVERQVLETRWGRRQPAPAPRFSRSSQPIPTAPGSGVTTVSELVVEWSDDREKVPAR